MEEPRLMRLRQVNAAVLCSASDKAHGSECEAAPAGDKMTDVFAYAVTGNDLFGVVDLTTGVFTERGDMGQRLTGLAVGFGGMLYGSGYSGGGYGAYHSPTLYSINPANGALTVVSNSFSAGYYDLGSTTTGLFADGSDGNLYSINPNTGAATLIGPTLLGNGLSTGSNTLYMTDGSTLYTINTSTGAATLVGSSSSGAFGSDVLEAGIIYGSSSDGAIYTLSSSNGAATFLSNLSGATGDLWGLAPFPSPPTVSAVTATTVSGATDLNAGHVVTITVDTTDTVIVTGTPTLQLNDNEVATYQSGTGTNSLTFTYTVQPGDNTADLQVTGLNLPSGATIQDGAGIALTGSVTQELALQIDTTIPTVGTTYDLTQDWSNGANPNGPWALLQGSTPLPFDAHWVPLGSPAWAPGNNPGNYLPGWFQATSVNANGFAVPLVVGDVYVHPTDYANGQFSGIANVQFTAPTAGIANISALLQNVGLTYRQQDWQLSVGGTVDLSGAVPLSATTYNLSDIVLSAGETVDLALFPDSNGLGTFVLTDLSINFVPPPSAPSITSVTDNVAPVIGTLTTGAYTNDPDPTVQVSLSGTGALVGDTLQLYNGTGTGSPLGSPYTLSNTDISNGFANVQPSTLNNGITYTLTARITDAAGNQSAVSTNSFTLTEDTDINEQAALSLTVNGGTPLGALIAGAVPFTVGGLDADDSGTVAFSDGSHAPVVVNIVNGVPAFSTANLSGLTDGPITATLHLNNDAAGNSFTDVVASATLDQDTNDHPTVTLTGLTGGNAVEGTAVTATVSSDDLPSSGIVYAWEISHDGGTTWTPISGATSNSYTPRESDEVGQLQAQVSFTDPAGNNETGTATVLNVVDAPPTLSVSIYTYTTLNEPGAGATFAQGINDSGQIVGNAGTGNQTAFLYSHGIYTALNDPLANANGTYAYGINNAGQIVGYYNTPNGRYGFLYSNGIYTTLNDPLSQAGTGVNTQAVGINNLGQIVGFYGDGNGAHGFLYSNGTYTTLNDPFGNTYAYGINDLGQIVGPYGPGHGFIYSNGTFTTLTDPLHGAAGINDLGQIIWAETVLNSNGTYTTINETNPLGINNLGQIVGYQANNGVISGFLATPVGPTVSVMEGSILTATPTTNDSDTTVTYQWQSLTGAVWANIPGGTGLTYQVTESDEGHQLRVMATSADSDGGSTSATSTPTSAVVDVPPALSVSVSGNAIEGSKLTATPTLGTDRDNTTADVTYQWERNGTAIGGATGSAYVVGEADEGAVIQVLASFTDDTGQSVQATSTPTGTVLDAPPTVTTPTIAGTAKEGVTLTASASAGQTDNTVTYQWFSSADGYTKAIGSGATYQVQEGDESHQIEVVATNTNDNGLTVSATSTPTGAVVDATPMLSVSIISNNITYTTIDPPGSIQTIAYSINDSGQIVGFYLDSSGHPVHGFLESRGIYTTIDPPGSIQTTAYSINASGQIIGWYFGSGGTHQLGFLDSGSTYTTIDPPGSHSTEPISINASGQIVGDYIDGNGQHGFLYGGGTYTIVDFPGAIDTIAQGINASGQIVGLYLDSNGSGHGFLDSGGTYTTIDPPGSVYTTVTGINASGQIVGYYRDSSGGPEHSFLDNGGTYTILNFPGATQTAAYSINDSGQIVGFYVDSSGREYGFLDSGGTYTTIDPPGSPGSIIQQAGINASGQIVGSYNGNGTEYGFLAVSAAFEGSILTATPTTNDIDATVTYQWQVLNGSTWANIKGATGSTYLVTEANEGHQLRVIATSSDADGGGTAATSTPTLAVTDIPPTLSVTVGGVAQQGQTLTATANAVSDGDGGKTTYQWQVLVGLNWVAIAGATHATYSVTEAVESDQIRVLATFTDDTGQAVSATSLPTTPVLDVTPMLSVTVTGTAQEGQKLTAHPLVTSDGDGGATTYQWQKLVGTVWTNIAGATASTYQVIELDEGSQLQVAAIFTDDTGQTASATGAATAAVIDIKPTLSVTVSGTAQDGQTLTAAAIANDLDALIGYQWQQLTGGTWTDIAGATGSTFAITEANEGSRLRAVATSSDSDGSGTSATSTATASVLDSAPSVTVPNPPSLFVAAGGSVSLPLSVSGFDSDDKVTVKIAGLPAFETITDNLDKKTFSGSSVTLTAAEVNSGLTLHSTYSGSGQPVNTLTVTAANTTAGESSTSSAQTITVTDPPQIPATLGGVLDHNGIIRGVDSVRPSAGPDFGADAASIGRSVGLLANYMASAFTSSGYDGHGALLADQSGSPWCETPTLVQPPPSQPRV
jgi:probable HAF family extracellular repeat protein